LVDAFNQVVERHPDAELKIVGPFEMLPKAYCIDLTDEPIVRELARFYRPVVYRATQIACESSGIETDGDNRRDRSRGAGTPFPGSRRLRHAFDLSGRLRNPDHRGGRVSRS